MSDVSNSIFKNNMKSNDGGFFIPLSFSQQRLWFLDQLQPGLSVYNMPMTFHFKGLVNANLLKKSINWIIKRHQPLRAIFPSVNGKPIQFIHKNICMELPEIDLRELPINKQLPKACVLVENEIERSFDLQKGPLIRALLVHMGNNECLLNINIHHIVFDGWSKAIFISELGEISNSLYNGKIPALKNISVNYSDFVNWQKKADKDGFYIPKLKYWTNILEGKLPKLDLPLDYPRPISQSFNGSNISKKLPENLTSKLQSLSISQGVTLFMTMLAAYKVLLYRYTNQEDIIVGSPIANRNHSQVEGLIGFFVNSLILRTDLSKNPSFSELLKRIRKVTTEAINNQDIPFEKLVDEFEDERDPSRNPIYQIGMSFQNTPQASLTLCESKIKKMSLNNKTSKFDLSLFVEKIENTLLVRFEYCTDLFKEATINRMLECYLEILESVVKNPNQNIDDINILGDNETHKIVYKWNRQTSSNSQEYLTLNKMFETQVEKSPDKIAVVFEDKKWTYAEINRIANQVAHYLIELGVNSEEIVGLCVERSIYTVIGILSILKAGCAYVPLDPQLPKDRLELIINDSNVRLILIQDHLFNKIPSQLFNIQTIVIDNINQVISMKSNINPKSYARNKNLAYVIHTSGSTGVPKGVMVSHSSVIQLLDSSKLIFKFNSSDIWTLFHSYAFDFSVWEMWGAFFSGGKLVVVPHWTSRSPKDFYDLLCSERVTVLNQTPSAFKQIINIESELKNFKLRSLKWVIFGGETLDVNILRNFLSPYRNHLQFVNMYGITETTIHSTYHVLTENELINQNNKNIIGKKLPHTKIYILNKNKIPVPIGVPGEIYIGGEGVAEGYINNISLTSERFVKNPFSHNPSNLMYKTGDFAKFHEDGVIEYLGREDQQVKIRGYRIELNEVKSAIEKHRDISETIVAIDQENTTKDKKIIAYIVPEKKSIIKLDENLSFDQVNQWEQVFDNNFQYKNTTDDPFFNIVGWNSSFTNEPLSEIEMQEWVSHTVDRILNLKPKNVLEIGFGTGLLLFRLAHHCESYIATDFSINALQYVQSVINDDNNGKWDNLTLFLKKADDLGGVEPNSQDTVIINSVTQYFPNGSYLYKVLEGAIKLIKPGGKIFVGDVRNLQWQKAFSASVETFTSLDISIKKLKQRIAYRMKSENELMIEPNFFLMLKTHFPEIVNVEVVLKRGKNKNEMTKFRYDVILHLKDNDQIKRENGTNNSDMEFEILNWNEQIETKYISDYVLKTRPKALLLKNVPNSRIKNEMEIIDVLEATSSEYESNILSQFLQKNSRRNISFDPEDFWALKDIPYNIQIYPSLLNPSLFDVGFITQNIQENLDLSGIYVTTNKESNLDSYFNNPLEGKVIQNIIPDLRNFLKKMLPIYMIPSSFVFINKILINNNGKIDYKSLSNFKKHTTFKSGKINNLPVNKIEKIISEVWCELLDLDNVSTNDNFFDIGGHSLLIVQVYNKLSRDLKEYHFSIIDLFHHPTISSLSEFLVKDNKEDNLNILQSEEKSSNRKKMIEKLREKRN